MSRDERYYNYKRCEYCNNIIISKEKYCTLDCYFFDSYIIDDNSECWLWTKGNSRKIEFSYKKCTYNGKRISYEKKYGKIPDGFLIFRLCKKKRCVNPEHLYLDNESHKAKKIKFSNCRFTKEEILKIRLDNRVYKEIAKDYNTTTTHIGKIKVAVNYNSSEFDLVNIPSRNRLYKLTHKDVIEIKKDDRLHRIIANDYGVSRSTISKIKLNKQWKDV